ncbi:hypothetical protein CAPTEDRAFT_215046 [Capitella teleta]|uniref:Phosducin domain-containing protein n=1 Tax=Capitella teleta TaxID=283909 RepID=R7TM68_CAPTE|nr:hypothetical protein CAPTEDRAFT_215046 [Capitella teleta]|eukprot:ELT92185.1 hypothetical protein CAPTEDRAFT_215046 [Capitella teleta]
MQDPNADTEWNDVLRSKGILPPKEEKEITEEDLVRMVEQTIDQKSKGKEMGDMDLDELNDLEDDVDEEEERIFEAYRRQRMQELKQAQSLAKFGDIKEISKSDWITEVNKAGEGIWVVVHIYQQGIPMCSLMNNYWLNSQGIWLLQRELGTVAYRASKHPRPTKPSAAFISPLPG